MLFGSGNKLPPQTLSLKLRSNRQQTEIAAFTAEFDIDAADDDWRVILLRHQKYPFVHQTPHTLQIDAIAVKGDAFDQERSVDQSDEMLRIFRPRSPDAGRTRRMWRIRRSDHLPITPSTVFASRTFYLERIVEIQDAPRPSL